MKCQYNRQFINRLLNLFECSNFYLQKFALPCTTLRESGRSGELNFQL